MKVTYRADFERKLDSKIVIKDWNLEYNILLIEIRFVEILIRVRRQPLLPLITDTQRQRLTSNVEAYVAGMTKSMLTHLEGLVPSLMINDRMKREQTELFRKMSNIHVHSLKVPLAEEDVSELLAKFDNLLKESRGRIEKRLSNVRKRPWVSEATAELFERMEREGILRDIIAIGMKMIRKRTTDPRIKALKGGNLVPGYHELTYRRAMLSKNLPRRTPHPYAQYAQQREKALAEIKNPESRSREFETQKEAIRGIESEGTPTKTPIREDGDIGVEAPLVVGEFGGDPETTEVKQTNSERSIQNLISHHPGMFGIIVVLNLLIASGITYIFIWRRKGYSSGR